jgi:hypothetical protein
MQQQAEDKRVARQMNEDFLKFLDEGPHVPLRPRNPFFDLSLAELVERGYATEDAVNTALIGAAQVRGEAPEWLNPFEYNQALQRGFSSAEAIARCALMDGYLAVTKADDAR